MRPRNAPSRTSRNQPPANVDVGVLHGILERSRSTPLGTEDYATLKSAVDTLAIITQQLELKGASVERLRKMLFGTSSEKSRDILGRPDEEKGAASKPSGSKRNDGGEEKSPGHGRNGVDAYPGATKHQVQHPSVKTGECCPDCGRGKVYPMKDPASLLRVTGMAPLVANVWECERLRCNGCLKVFTAPAPAGIGEEKYDASAAAMLGVLRFDLGVPHNRIEKLQQSAGVPFPASTQWDVIDEKCELLEPAYEELLQQAARGEVLHNDDTPMKVLELMAQTPQEAKDAGATDEMAERTGIRTTGIVAATGDRKITLFFTGRKHAGDNLEDVLKRRPATMEAAIQMCDGLSHNVAGDFKTILGICLIHARRNFVDVVSSFPEESRYVIEQVAKVYAHEADTQDQKLTKAERLIYHQRHSGPVMAELKTWMKQQMDGRIVEPNSPLGEAIRYALKRWEALTLFLRIAGAPLDNNVCERVLKKAIMHRKNSLFYKSVRGAHVGDVFMSLIHTATLNGADPFHYLVTLMRNAAAVAQSPSEWMPWNYQQNAA